MPISRVPAGARRQNGITVSTKLLLVDYENVQQLDFTLLGESYQVTIFVGASQKNVPIELVASAQQLGSRVEWRRADGNGKNALDFFIACELGSVRERTPGMHCTILSKDQGFDPLLRHLNKNGLKCVRINSLLELGPKTASKREPNYTRVVELLVKTVKNARPRTRLTLSKHVSAMFQNKLSAGDLNRIIDLLFANKMISETNNRLAYEF